MIRALLACVIAIGLSRTCIAQDWKPVTVELLKSEKTGFGGLCGVAVHPSTGDLIINLSDRGLFQSMDQGTTWQRLGTAELKGRTETPLCLMIDPLSQKRLVSSFVYGSPIIVAEGLEGQWKTLDATSQHVDWCAVDWNDPDFQFILTLKHESGDLLLISHSGGQSFSEVGKGYGPAWVFDRTTAVVAEAKSKSNEMPGLLRTTDAGKTFQRCGNAYAKALPRFKSGHLFWLTTTGLLHTSDQGKSWDQRSEIQSGICGPVFGSNVDHLLVLTMKGILESKDGGKTWQQPIALPAEMKGANYLSWVEYDALHDILYVMKMGSELYQWRRMKP